MHEQWQPAEPPVKGTFQELMQPARAQRRAATVQRRANRRVRSRVLLIIACTPLVAGSAVGGYHAAGWIRDQVGSDDSTVGATPDTLADTTVPTVPATPEVLDTGVMTVTMPGTPLATDTTETVAGVEYASHEWTVQTADLVITVAQVDLTKIATAGGYDVNALFDAMGSNYGNVGTIASSLNLQVAGEFARQWEIVDSSLAPVFVTAAVHANTLVLISSTNRLHTVPPEYTTAVASVAWKA